MQPETLYPLLEGHRTRAYQIPKKKVPINRDFLAAGDGNRRLNLSRNARK